MSELLYIVESHDVISSFHVSDVSFSEKHKSLVSLVYVCCDNSDLVVECCVAYTKSVPSLKFESTLEV